MSIFSGTPIKYYRNFEEGNLKKYTKVNEEQLVVLKNEV